MKLDVEKRKKEAQENFLNGYNCSQAVVLAFSDILNIDTKVLLSLASSFGGGIARLRDTCGAVSGIAMVLGILYGYSTPETGDIKKEHYERIQKVIREFEDKNKTIICRELLEIKVKHSDPTPTPRDDDFYQCRPCENLIGDAVTLIAKYINEKEN